jgi:hypothetical protein
MPWGCEFFGCFQFVVELVGDRVNLCSGVDALAGAVWQWINADWKTI